MTKQRARLLMHAAKVDQHRQQQVGRSTSLARTCALATALASCADEPCGKLSLNELAMVFAHRSQDKALLSTVDEHTLFTLFVAIDDELQSRKESREPEMVSLPNDVPSITPFASAVGVDDADHAFEAMMVRSIHAEVLDPDEFEY